MNKSQQHITDRVDCVGPQPQENGEDEDEHVSPSSHLLLESTSSPDPRHQHQHSIPHSYSSPSSSRWSSEYRSFGLMLLAQAFSAAMNTCVKLLESAPSGGLHTAQILFIRMGITFLAITGYLIYRDRGSESSLLGARENRKMLLVRGVGGCLGVGGLYYSLQSLPLSLAITITFLTPIVTSLGCAIFLREAYPARQKAAGAIALCGVILLVNLPSSSSSQDAGSLGSSITSADRILALTTAFVGVFGSAAALTSIRHLTRTEHPLVPVNYLCGTALLTSTIFLVFVPSQGRLTALTLLTTKELILLTGASVCGFANQLLLTLALQSASSASSARSMNAMYTQAVFAVTLDLLVFRTVPSVGLGAGCVLVLAGTAWAVAGKEKEKRDCAREGGSGTDGDLSDLENGEIQIVTWSVRKDDVGIE